MTSMPSNNTIDTLYGEVCAAVFARLKNIKLLVCDVDGVFSDGSIYLGNNGEEYKAFNTKDGYGIKAVQNVGIEVAVITGRKSKIVESRMHSLGVKHLIQGRVDKSTAITEIINAGNYTSQQVISIGDDMPDIGMFANSAIGVAVADAHPYVQQQANYVTTLGGGRGAVREVCDLLLQANDALETQHGASI